MDNRETALIDRLASEGVSIIEADIVQWGLYIRERRMIVLQAGMKANQRLATLHHEALHHWRGDNGHQTSAVEDEINRQVAMELITPSAYAYAERVADGHVAGIATELDLPVWVIRAYQQTLSAQAGANARFYSSRHATVDGSHACMTEM